jgi:hypothetical protein
MEKSILEKTNIRNQIDDDSELDENLDDFMEEEEYDWDEDDLPGIDGDEDDFDDDDDDDFDDKDFDDEDIDVEDIDSLLNDDLSDDDDF